ncbi:ankyrin repeat domain-containing protein [Novosphingobium sp. AP12]|uniref:ankyrin repeat domain-containing protein n=1 Tax=Novosphingobium sp. AP12 TaxID=1144305 RepID=UPI00056B5489|nr:ankyrin repeat domain-containing protein [Novosphingobium sp. AP12]
MVLLALVSAPAYAQTDTLAEAITASDLAGTEAALKAGTSPNEPLAYGESPLARAIETQEPAMVALLLANGAKPNTADAEGLTPLALACERGNEGIVAQLLDARADVRKAGPDGSTPLAVCARYSTANTVAKMLAKGAKVDAPDSRGQTSLMWAASAGHVEAIGLLLKAGAKVNRVTAEGFTPLFFAIASGSGEATRALLDAGADASHRGPENTSAAQLAMYQKNWRAAQMLVERGGVDLAERDRNGEQMLHAAAAGGDEALVSVLLAKGADANGLTGPSRIKWVTEANFGMPPPPVPPTPPLLVAAQHGQVAVMKRLVAGGANPAFVAENGVNVVLAAASGHSAAALAEALALAPGANVADAKGTTALHLLLGGGMAPELPAMLRVLATHGARPDLANKKGTTPAQMAEGGLATVKAVYDQVFGQKAPPVLASNHP